MAQTPRYSAISKTIDTLVVRSIEGELVFREDLDVAGLPQLQSIEFSHVLRLLVAILANANQVIVRCVNGELNQDLIRRNAQHSLPDDLDRATKCFARWNIG